MFLVSLDALEVIIEEVAGVQWAPPGLGMELGREDRAGFVDDAFIGGIIQIDKVLNMQRQ